MFDIAQSIFETWKVRKEQNAIKYILKHIEKEVNHADLRLKDCFKIWRLQT